MYAFTTFLVGFIFSIGLGVGGMTQPHKVTQYLDLFNWDYSLILVMAGALTFHILTYKLIMKRHHPIFGKHWHVQNRKDITWQLVVGALIFGIGWGLGGFCPGPGIASLASGSSHSKDFVIAMFFGMMIYHRVEKRLNLKK